MATIPQKIRYTLANDPFMRRCIHDNADCEARIEWEHALTFAGKQVQEVWAIIPCCTYHHRKNGLNKRFNRFIAVYCMPVEDQLTYAKAQFVLERNGLLKEYENANPNLLDRCEKRKAYIAQSRKV